MDFSLWTLEKSIIAPSVQKYREVKKRNYTPDGKKTKGVFGEFAGFYRWDAKNKRVGPACFFATKRI